MGQTQELDMKEIEEYRQHGQVQTGTTIVRITGASETRRLIHRGVLVFLS